MKKKTFLVLIPALFGMLIMTDASPAKAQYHRQYAPVPPRPHAPQRPRLWRPWHRTHFYFGGQLGGTVVVSQKMEQVGVIGHGGGLGLHVGARLGRFVSLEGNWNLSVHDELWGCEDPHGYCADGAVDNININTLTADVKFHIPTWSKLEPYVQAGGGWAFMGESGQYGEAHTGPLASGPTFNLGGGLNFYVGRWLSFGGRLLYRGIYFGQTQYGKVNWDNNFVHAVSVDATIGLHF